MEGYWPPTKCTQCDDEPSVWKVRPGHAEPRSWLPKIFTSTMAAADDKET
jgi:hypothetical protein